MRKIAKIIFICVLVIVFIIFLTCETKDIETEPMPKIFKTLTGECYHLEDCVSLRYSKISITLEDALRAGLRSCGICNPSIQIHMTLDAK